MNYGSLIYNKIRIWTLSLVFSFRKSWLVEICVRIVGVFCIINCSFRCDYRIRCHFLYIGRYVKGVFRNVSENVPEVWSISVRFVLGFFVIIFFPPSPSPSLASMSKFPTGEKIWDKLFSNDFFCDIYEKIENGTKMIASCNRIPLGYLAQVLASCCCCCCWWWCWWWWWCCWWWFCFGGGAGYRSLNK